MAQRVLVTGGSGFVAGHCILALLDAGYDVRTTVRSLDREASVRESLRAAGADAGDRLTFAAADLTDDAGWAEAVDGCDFVLHVASPLPTGTVTNEDDVIIPARDGTLRVLRFARDGGVKRVVFTSAFATQGFGWGRTAHVFTDDDHSVVDGPGVNAYYRSKIVAELAAWDFMTTEGGALELTTINPVAITGPILGGAASGTNHLLQMILTGGLPGYPDFWMPIVDVRDVATAHVLAMTAADAAGQRFIAYSGSGMTMKEVGMTLKAHVSAAAGAKIPTRSIPNIVIRVGALFSPTMKEIVSDLGVTKQIDGSKARRVLGWQPRDARTSVEETGDSMVAAGLVG